MTVRHTSNRIIEAIWITDNYVNPTLGNVGRFRETRNNEVNKFDSYIFVYEFRLEVLLILD